MIVFTISSKSLTLKMILQPLHQSPVECAYVKKANISQTVLSFLTTTLEHIYPGQEFSIRLAVVSHWWPGAPGVVPGIFVMLSSNATLQLSPRYQASNYQTCTNFSYSLNTMLVDRYVTFVLGTKQYSEFVPFTVHLMECTLGFPFSQIQGKRICDPASHHYDMECKINSHRFWRSANSRTWIGFIDESSDASSKSGVMYHPNCPIRYCSHRDVNITSNTSDDQCEPHHTGLLCGECEVGYSLDHPW